MTETPEQRQKLKRWFHGAVIPSVRIGGKICVIGTILHEDSLLMSLLSARGWVSRIYDAEEGPLWPEAFTMEDLAQIRAQYADQGQLDVYYREYRNKIIDTEHAAFKREYFRYITVDEFNELESVNFFALMDPAYTTSTTSDYTAIGILATDADNTLYVRKLWRGRWGMIESIQYLLDVAQTFSVKAVGMQTVDWTKSFQVPLTEEMRRRNVFFNVTPLQTYSQTRGLHNKKTRIERLSPRYAAGQIVHVGKQPLLEDELLSFPRSKNDDVMDMVSMGLDLIWPAGRKKRGNPWPKYMDDVSDSISGY